MEEEKHILSDLITLAMPVYNTSEDVERALLSALNQTYENIEFLIIDDRGTDNSMEIVKNIISQHPRGKDVRIITHPVNIGTGAARNSAIEQAKGKFLFFMDSDDEITPDCIQKLHKKMREEDVDIVCGSYRKIQGQESSCLTGFHVAMWNKLYKLSFLRTNNIKCIPSQLMEDVFFYVQVLVTTRSYLVIPDVTYLYYLRIQSHPKEWSERFFKDWRQVPADVINILNKSSADIQTRIKIRKKLFWLAIGASGLALKNSNNVQPYINDYLNPNYLKNKDTLHNWILILAYIFSCMPLGIKKILLALYVKLPGK